MPRYEYKVVPAPSKGQKAKGVKTAEGRFALTIQDTLNQMGADGWEYQRAELLPSDERSGLTGTTQNWRNVLIFRRALDTADARPDLQADPVVTASVAAPATEPEPLASPVDQPAASDTPHLLLVKDAVPTPAQASDTLTARRPGEAPDDDRP